MNASYTTEPRVDGVLFADEFADEFDDDPIAEWSLDELDESADLASLRSAWSAADGFDD